MVGSLAADSLHFASKVTEQQSEDYYYNQPSFVPPRPAASRARPRHQPLHVQEALKVLSRASTPGTEELPPRCVLGATSRVVCVVRVVRFVRSRVHRYNVDPYTRTIRSKLVLL